MYATVLKSKLHNVVVTDSKLNYVGSITIDKNLMDAVGLVRNEKVLVVNNRNGARIETYVIVGRAGTGIICLNGAAAHHFNVGDQAIIMSFTSVKLDYAEEHEPRVIFPQESNKNWLSNSQVCYQIFADILGDNDKILESDVEEVALRMGRELSDMKVIVEQVYKNKQD